MTLLPSLPGTRDVPRLAATARSILACPDGASLVVDGLDDVMAGIDDTDGNGLGLQDLSGTPTFSCPPDVPLSVAARARRRALLTLGSGLGTTSSAERDAVLTLGGNLRSEGVQDCGCCGETREVVVLDVTFVMLAPVTDLGEPVRVPVAAFRSREHHLNRGYLQRSVEHANSCHQEELRRAISTLTGTRLGDVVGVALTDLRPGRVEVRWVEPWGASSRVLDFPRTARDAEELGDLLRERLHAGLC